jgi:hypothetical protein
MIVLVGFVVFNATFNNISDKAKLQSVEQLL